LHTKPRLRIALRWSIIRLFFCRNCATPLRFSMAANKEIEEVLRASRVNFKTLTTPGHNAIRLLNQARQLIIDWHSGVPVSHMIAKTSVEAKVTTLLTAEPTNIQPTGTSHLLSLVLVHLCSAISWQWGCCCCSKWAPWRRLDSHWWSWRSWYGVWGLPNVNQWWRWTIFGILQLLQLFQHLRHPRPHLGITTDALQGNACNGVCTLFWILPSKLRVHDAV
jgi:hypothetical protein